MQRTWFEIEISRFARSLLAISYGHYILSFQATWICSVGLVVNWNYSRCVISSQRLDEFDPLLQKKNRWVRSRPFVLSGSYGPVEDLFPILCSLLVKRWKRGSSSDVNVNHWMRILSCCCNSSSSALCLFPQLGGIRSPDLALGDCSQQSMRISRSLPEISRRLTPLILLCISDNENLGRPCPVVLCNYLDLVQTLSGPIVYGQRGAERPQLLSFRES